MENNEFPNLGIEEKKRQRVQQQKERMKIVNKSKGIVKSVSNPVELLGMKLDEELLRVELVEYVAEKFTDIMLSNGFFIEGTNNDNYFNEYLPARYGFMEVLEDAFNSLFINGSIALVIDEDKDNLQNDKNALTIETGEIIMSQQYREKVLGLRIIVKSFEINSQTFSLIRDYDQNKVYTLFLTAEELMKPLQDLLGGGSNVSKKDQEELEKKSGVKEDREGITHNIGEVPCVILKWDKNAVPPHIKFFNFCRNAVKSFMYRDAEMDWNKTTETLMDLGGNLSEKEKALERLEDLSNSRLRIINAGGNVEDQLDILGSSLSLKTFANKGAYDTSQGFWETAMSEFLNACKIVEDVSGGKGKNMQSQEAGQQTQPQMTGIGRKALSISNKFQKLIYLMYKYNENRKLGVFDTIPNFEDIKVNIEPQILMSIKEEAEELNPKEDENKKTIGEENAK